MFVVVWLLQLLKLSVFWVAHTVYDLKDIKNGSLSLNCMGDVVDGLRGRRTGSGGQDDLRK